MTERAMQLSILPDLERPVGPVPPSVLTGTNADLIAAVAGIYLTGSVLDITFGSGGWWRRYRPEPFAAHDLELDQIDFRRLPDAAASWDTVCFDPPYVPQGGGRANGYVRPDEATYRARFGLTEPRSRLEMDTLIAGGIAEACRVARSWVLVKCADYTSGQQFHLGHLAVIDAGRAAGYRVHDLIIHHSGHPVGNGYRTRTIIRTARHHSYLVVLTPIGGTRT